jgi:hypothetical protein
MAFWTSALKVVGALVSVKFVAVVGTIIVAKTVVANLAPSTQKVLGNASVELGPLKLQISDFGFEGSTSGQAYLPFGLAEGSESGGAVVQFSLNNSCVPTSTTTCLVPPGGPIVTAGTTNTTTLRAIISPDSSYTSELTANSDIGSAKAFSSFNFGLSNPQVDPNNLSTYVSNSLYSFSDSITNGTRTTTMPEQSIDFPISEGQYLYLGFASSVGGAAVVVPEPSELLSIFTLGTLGAASILKRKLKPSQSKEKELTKVG